jgi:hypothetical protein
MSNVVGTVNFANILPFSEPSFAGLLRPKVELVRDYYLCQSSWKCRGTRCSVFFVLFSLAFDSFPFSIYIFKH